MDVKYTLQDIRFRWNSDKAASNRRRHRVTFEKACEAFFDPFFCVIDAGLVEGERREAVIGMTVDWQLLTVVFVMREDVVRIISARAAVEGERKEYENQ